MAKDILSGFGPDTPTHQKARATSGGIMPVTPIPYDPPKGPTTFWHQGPGLADHENHSNAGTQGHHMKAGPEEGSPGLGGQRPKPHGSER